MAACASRVEALALPYQRRATQSRVRISRSARIATGARGWTPPGANTDARNEAGNGDFSDCAVNRVQVGGRSRVIHASLVGFRCL
jgi:hypothetical protein